MIKLFLAPHYLLKKGGQLFQNNQQIKKWGELKTEIDLIKNEKSLVVQITHSQLTILLSRIII